MGKPVTPCAQTNWFAPVLCGTGILRNAVIEPMRSTASVPTPREQPALLNEIGLDDSARRKYLHEFSDNRSLRVANTRMVRSALEQRLHHFVIDCCTTLVDNGFDAIDAHRLPL